MRSMIAQRRAASPSSPKQTDVGLTKLYPRVMTKRIKASMPDLMRGFIPTQCFRDKVHAEGEDLEDGSGADCIELTVAAGSLL